MSDPLKCLLLFCLAAIVGLISPIAAGTKALEISGTITDSSGTGIAGASVLLYRNGEYLTGTSTAAGGGFSLSVPDSSTDSLILTASSIGFMRREIVFEKPGPLTIDIVLAKSSVKGDDIEVSGIRQDRLSSHPVISQDRIARAGQASLVPTNPISGIRQPEVMRSGTQHSSKLRVFGASPEYYLNDIPIGQDPNHYGIFSIIPGAVVDNIQFYPYGTPAEYGPGALLSIATPRRFERHAGGSVNLSFIEATASVSVGDERYFMLGAVRKSVLDRIINHLDIRSDRRTIPPTNFQDVFLSAGYQLSPSLYLISDQFHARDYLAYQTESTHNNPQGVATFQHSRENYLGVRLEGYKPRTVFSIRAAGRIREENYSAHSGVPVERGGLQVDLDGYQRQFLLRSDVKTTIGGTKISYGQDLKYIFRRMIDMDQYNWNFLPPDATSDNLHPFQKALNYQYNSYYVWDDEINSAAYLSVSRSSGRFTIEPGARLEYFGNLKNRFALTLRQTVTARLSDKERLEWFIGSFAENPTGRIIEAYQVLVHANLGRLRPVRSLMTSLRYLRDDWSVSLFARRVDRLPELDPAYGAVDKSMSQFDNFIGIQSGGRRRFYGGNVSYCRDNVLMPGLSLYGYYSYTFAQKTTDDITVPYELNSPHTAFIQTEYIIGRGVKIGGDMTYRSGYAYTPSYGPALFNGSTLYSDDFYDSVLRLENSERFPTYAVINISGSYSFGKTEIFGAISNITNHKNPIISAHDGFIYDAGILPTIGLVHKF